VFAVGDVGSSLRVTEIMYHPVDPNHEFIELQNVGSEAIDINLVRITKGVDYSFNSIEVPADGYVLLVKNEPVFRQYYPDFAGVIAGQFEGSLDNDGEKIRLKDAIDETIIEFDYNDRWHEITDGLGFSLTIRDAYSTDPNLWDDKSGWRPSAAVGGSPGYDDTGYIPGENAIVINEVMAHSHGTLPDWIELYNTTGQPISIGRWFLSDSITNLEKYEIASGVIIPAYGYFVLTEDETFNNEYDPGSHVPFALSENGDEIYLNSGADGELAGGYSEEEDFGASETGVSFGRYLKTGDNIDFVPMSQTTKGSQNAYPKIGPVVITEIMYHPKTNEDAEYVEITNITNNTVNLYDEITGQSWKFTDSDGIELFIPYGTTIDPNERLLLVKNQTAIQLEFTDVPAETQLFQWAYKSLDNGGEKIQLSKPGDVDETGKRYFIRVDRVVYDDKNGWPTEPDGTGKSLERITNTDYGNDVINWQTATPTPGS
ncbi:MAG: lamin tail domain-containing protein, partial [Anaerohalosphaera sp.]|nr:lamin tail domain-containing protein [Anaerohalosphaera sp.]